MVGTIHIGDMLDIMGLHGTGTILIITADIMVLHITMEMGTTETDTMAETMLTDMEQEDLLITMIDTTTEIILQTDMVLEDELMLHLMGAQAQPILPETILQDQEEVNQKITLAIALLDLEHLQEIMMM